jgi:hypothetical protein
LDIILPYLFENHFLPSILHISEFYRIAAIFAAIEAVLFEAIFGAA